MSEILKRRGCIKVNNDLIEKEPEKVINIFKNILIVKLDSDFFTNSLIYYGYSRHFDILEEGEPIPEYVVAVESNNNIKFIREGLYKEKDIKKIINELKDDIVKEFRRNVQ